MMISLSQVQKSYQLAGLVSPVLHDISLQIRQGEMVAIVGASGSGKSTLMNLIGLLDSVGSGSYQLHGKDVNGLNEDERALLRNLCFGFVFQQFHLLPRFNALHNVGLPLTYRDGPANMIRKKAAQALERVGMQSFHNHKPTQLSGGQQQRVAIARALVGEPEVILADEPTGALDSRTGQEIMQLFLDLHREGRTILIVTHDEAIAAQCTRRIVLADGQIVTDEAV